jgi:hypothetical protein
MAFIITDVDDLDELQQQEHLNCLLELREAKNIYRHRDAAYDRRRENENVTI